MNMWSNYLPTTNSNRWNFPKFHKLLHAVDDMSRFGAPTIFCAQRPKSLLISAAKQPGTCAQKRHRGIDYKLQAAQRLSASGIMCMSESLTIRLSLHTRTSPFRA